MPEPRMTSSTQRVLRVLLQDSGRERDGVEISAAAGLPSGSIHPVLASLEGVGWLRSRWASDPALSQRPPRRCYRLSEDGSALAVQALARAYRPATATTWLRPVVEER